MAELQTEFDASYGEGGGEVVRIFRDARPEHEIGVAGLEKTFIAIGDDLFQQGKTLGQGGYGHVFIGQDEAGNQRAIEVKDSD